MDKKKYQNKALNPEKETKTVEVNVVRSFSVDGVTYVPGKHKIPESSFNKVSKIHYK